MCDWTFWPGFERGKPIGRRSGAGTHMVGFSFPSVIDMPNARPVGWETNPPEIPNARRVRSGCGTSRIREEAEDRPPEWIYSAPPRAHARLKARPGESMSEPRGSRSDAAGPRPLESTASLLHSVRGGDEAAAERVITRFAPPLQRLARRWLPLGSRDLDDTDDLVFTTLARGLRSVKRGGFDSRGEGAFLAYLRGILLNEVKDQKRRARSRSPHDDLRSGIPDDAPSPLERAIGVERLEMFEAALSRLPERKRQAVILRFEFGYSYEEVAAAIDFPSPGAARMQVARSLVLLTELLDGR